MTDARVGARSGRSGGAAMRFATPFVYALALLPAVAVTVALGSVLSGIFGAGSLWYALLVITGLFVGAAVYGGIGRFFIAAERLERSGIGDHLRRCAILYIVLVVTLIWGVLSFVSTGGVGWPTFATEMQLHIVSVVLAALAVDKLIASSIANNSDGGTT